MMSLSRLSLVLNLTIAIGTPSSLFGVGLDESVRGEVWSLSGKPLGGAHIQVVELGRVTTANGEGRFTIHGLPPGQWTILITHLGYQSHTFKVQVWPGESVSVGRITLTESPVSLPEAEVKYPIPFSDLPNPPFLLHRRQWEELGVRSLPELLNRIPGLIVLEGGHLVRVSFRGSPPRTTRVELDGAPINDPASGEADLSPIPFTQLESVEVQPLPLGGVIRLSTRKLPTYSTTDRWEMIGKGGSFHHRQAAFSGDIRLGSTEVNQYGQRRYQRGDFLYQAEDHSHRARINNHLSALGVGSSLSFQKRLFLTSHWWYQERGIPGLLYSAPTPQATHTRQRLALTIRYDPSWGGKDVGVKLYGAISRSLYTNPPLQINPLTRDTIHHLGEKEEIKSYQWGGESGMKVGLWGTIFTFTLSHQGESYEAQDLYRHQPLSGIRGGDSWRLAHQIKGQISKSFKAGKGDLKAQGEETAILYHLPGEKPQFHLAPSLSLTYCLPGSEGEWVATLSGGKGFSPPPLASLFTVEGVYAVGNPHLKPEEATGANFSVSYTHNMPYAHITISGNHFIRFTRNLIVWRRNWLNKFYPQNLNETRAYGGEYRVEWDLKPLPLRLEGHYIINDHRLYMPEDINHGNLIPYTPLHSGQGGIYAKWGGWSLWSRVRALGRRYSTEANTDPISTAGMSLDPYWVWDAGVERTGRVKSIMLRTFLEIDNLANAQYRVVERTPMPGRSVNFGIHLTLSDSSK